MTGIGHLIVAGVLSYHFSLNPVFALLGAVLPDKDLVWGWGKRKKRTLLNSHRGITHHFFIVPLLFTLYYLYPYPELLAFAVGYTSHLVMDAMTPLGIPYRLSYYPRFSIPVYKTGSWREWVIVGIVLISAVAGNKELKNLVLSFLP